MPDRRQVLRALLLGAAGLAVPAACGLPSAGHPIVDGPGPAPGGSGGSVPKAPTPADATRPEDLVRNFFAAVAGRIRPDTLTVADERARKFLTGEARATWPAPANGITVVRLDPEMSTAIGSDAGSTLVAVTLRPIGMLNTDGTVSSASPQSNGASRKMTFTVVQTGESGRPFGYLISKIEGDQLGMMLDSAQMDGNYFIPQLIYFWSTDRTGLVPDLRYVPAAGVSPEIQYTDIVDWVLGGPSPFLADAVQAKLYDGNSIVGPNLTAPDAKDGLLINLTIPPSRGISYGQVMAQLRWSLRPLYDGTVRLQVGSQPVQADGSSPTNFRQYNPADHDHRGEETVEYCVANGVVRPIAPPNDPPAVLGDAAVNKDVVLAALSRDLTRAALVKKIEKQPTQMWVVDGQQSGAPAVRPVTVSGAPLQGQVWSRPAFLPMDSARVLVAVDAGLYLVRMSDGQATELTAPPVSAFAVGTDGRRIALISNGAANVYSLQVSGDGVSLGGQGRLLDVGLTNCTAISWSRLERVLIAGQRGSNVQLVEATVDGVVLTDWSQFQAPILSISALPPVAWNPSTSPEVALMQTGNGAVRARSKTADPLLKLGPSDQPSPSPSPSAGTADLGVPTYPFYVG